MMLLTGFMAQMVDGSLGMGYGTISTTFLLAIGVNPVIVSTVHTARVFSSGVSGYSHIVSEISTRNYSSPSFIRALQVR
jgi:uncharacterized membrane protein YfcA